VKRRDRGFAAELLYKRFIEKYNDKTKPKRLFTGPESQKNQNLLICVSLPGKPLEAAAAFFESQTSLFILSPRRRSEKKRSSPAELAGLTHDKSASCADNLEIALERPRRLSGTPRQKERPCPVTDAFLDATNHVAAGRLIECGTDGLAQARADELADELFADTEYPAMEIWDGARFVYQATRHGGRPPLS
jgi:hypothetical protein